MPEDYTIEQLEKTFKEHAETYEGNCKKDIKRFGEPVFNISAALHVICREINQLKESINQIKDELS